MTAIVDIIAREILDSRGNPTVEVDVVLEDGTLGRAAVPSGASTGAHEAVELRDGDKKRYLGKGVHKAVERQRRDRRSAERHGRRRAGPDRPHDDRSRRHAEQEPARRQRHPGRLAGRAPRRPPTAVGMPLYRYLGGTHGADVLPVPMMNIINGGKHADNTIDFQEFMIMPVGRRQFAEALRCGAEMFHALKKVPARRPATTPMSATRAVLHRTCVERCERSSSSWTRSSKAGYKAGDRRRASRWTAPRPSSSKDGNYVYGGDEQRRSRGRADGRISSPTWCDKLSDHLDRGRLSEDDWDGWKELTDCSATSASWSATICSSPTRAAGATASRTASPTPS